jgi:hypothetical protein
MPARYRDQEGHAADGWRKKARVALPSVCRFADANESEGEKGPWRALLCVSFRSSMIKMQIAVNKEAKTSADFAVGRSQACGGTRSRPCVYVTGESQGGPVPGPEEATGSVTLTLWFLAL